MTTHVFSDELRSATESVSTSFHAIPAEPVWLDRADEVRHGQLTAIADRYQRHGFAVVQLRTTAVGPDDLLTLAGSLDLGEPFLPALYRRPGVEVKPYSRISAAKNRVSSDAGHPSFGRTVGQEFHCDGTLQPIGLIKATVLLCEWPAVEGGETTLFNASAAYAELASVDADAAAALATPGVLVRQANINGSAEENRGPAFAVRDGRLVAGYSVTATDRWEMPAGRIGDDLVRGVDYLRNAARPGSPYHLQFSLGACQAIVFDNTRISHGRLAYRDSGTRPSCLYRGLFLRHPILPAGEISQGPVE